MQPVLAPILFDLGFAEAHAAIVSRPASTDTRTVDELLAEISAILDAQEG